jgi:hypothetical protein
MTNNERIEAYFNNKLTESDRQQLMQDIDSDASLKSEFQFQENVIDGIKNYRKRELIARLDNIQVASTGQSLLLKAIGAVGIATVVTVGTYMWINRAEDQPITNEEVNNTEQLVVQPEETQEGVVNEIPDNPVVEEEEEDTTGDVVADADDTEANNAKADTSKPAAIPPAKDDSAVVPIIVIPEVDEPETAASVNVDEDLSAPEAMASSSIRLRSSTDVEVKLSKKYDFHYQVKDGGLILFGKFNDSPFEVIELKTNQGINSYLYFEEHFYSLVNVSQQIMPLIQIENKQLIKELEKRR